MTPKSGPVIACVGTSHRVAPVRVLEQALAGAESFCRTFPEATLLATCNRVEVYAMGESACASGDALGISNDVVYDYRGREALRHLCRVAAGLDSLVVGEPQIAGQVAQAFANATQPLAKAAAFALNVSRRARIETGIARRPASISSVAVHVAAAQANGLAGKRVLVLGAGKMGSITCQLLRNSRAHVTVANRTLATAQELAERVGAVPAPLSQLTELLADADIAIASTASPVPLIDRATIAPRSTTLHLIDIAVPRNVSEDVLGMDGVQLTGIDDLRTRVAEHLAERRKEIPRVEAIIEEELKRVTRTAHFTSRV